MKTIKKFLFVFQRKREPKGKKNRLRHPHAFERVAGRV